MYFTEFIIEKELEGASKSTVLNYKQAYKKLEADLPSKENIEKMKKRLLEAGLKPSSINTHIRCMKAYSRWCVENGYLAPQNASKFIKTQEETPEFYTKDEINALLSKKCKSFMEKRDRLIILFILGTGARAESIRELRVSDVSEGYITLRHTKNKRPLVVPASDYLEKEIKKFVRLYELNDFVFVNQDDGRLEGIWVTLKKYVESCGVEFKGVHAFRHTYAREFILAGGSAFVLKRLLGHSSLRMTQRYVTLFAPDLRDEILKFDILGQYVGGKKRLR